MPTWVWLLLAGVGQPIAMEAYRWAPWLVDDPGLARLLVRQVTLAGPILVMAPLAIVPSEDEAHWCNSFRFYAPFIGLGLLLAISLEAGLEPNAPYRVAFLLLQILLAVSWWCAVRGERPWWYEEHDVSSGNYRLAHSARLAGFIWACLGVGVCLLDQFVLAWDTMGGTIPDYDPWADDPSQAGALGLHWQTWALVLGSYSSILALWHLDRCGAAIECRMWLRIRARNLQARMLRIR